MSTIQRGDTANFLPNSGQQHGTRVRWDHHDRRCRPQKLGTTEYAASASQIPTSNNDASVTLRLAHRDDDAIPGSHPLALIGREWWLFNAKQPITLNTIHTKKQTSKGTLFLEDHKWIPVNVAQDVPILSLNTTTPGAWILACKQVAYVDR